MKFSWGLSLGVFERFVFEKTVLNTYRGARSAQVRFAVGIMQYCVTPKVKDAPVYESKVLVVESRFNGNSIYMYVVQNPFVVERYPGIVSGGESPIYNRSSA